MRFTENIAAFQLVLGQPAAADRQIAHVAIEHGQRGRCMLDKQPQPAFAFGQCDFGQFTVSDVTRDTEYALHFAIDDQRALGGQVVMGCTRQGNDFFVVMGLVR